jgi:hypothetical protein
MQKNPDLIREHLMINEEDSLFLANYARKHSTNKSLLYRLAVKKFVKELKDKENEQK